MAVSIHGNNGVITTNGTAAAPSLAAPDNDTGLYFGTNLIKASTDGTERLSITSDGKIAMGITSTSASNTCDPDGNQLLIRGASTFQTNKGHIMLTGDGATVGEGPQIVFSESGSGGNFAGAYIGHVRKGGNSQGDLVFGTRNIAGDVSTVPTERLRITSTGRVGIGTDNPSEVLHVIQSGTTAAEFRLENNEGYLLLRADSNVATYGAEQHIFHNRANSTEYLRITSAGDVGIGYNSPTVKLHVREAASGASSYDNRHHIIIEDDAEAYLGLYLPDNGYGGIRFYDTTGQEGLIDYYFATDDMHFHSTGTHIFKTAGSERLRIDSSGKLGLGMSSDQKTALKGKLDIDASGIDAAGDTDDSDDYAIVIRNPSTTNQGNGIAFTNDSGANVGGAIIHIDKGTNNIGDLAFYTAASSNTPLERLRITSGGDVSIGGRDEALSNYAAGSTTTQLAVVKDGGAAGSGYHEVAHFTAGSDSNDTGAIVRITQFNNDRGLYIKAGRGTSDQAKAIFGLRNSSAADQDVMTFLQGGNVVIGHTTAGNKLQIGNTGHSGYGFAMNSATYGAVLQVGDGADPTTAAALWVRNLRNGGTIRTIFRANGNGVVIAGNTSTYDGGGTKPNLYVRGTGGRQMKIHNPNAGTCSLQMTNATTGQGEDAGTQLFTQGGNGDFWIQSAYATADIAFATKPSGGSTTERLRIDSNGNLKHLVSTPTAYTATAPSQLRFFGKKCMQGSVTSTATLTGSGTGIFDLGRLWLTDDSSTELFIQVMRNDSTNYNTHYAKAFIQKVRGTGMSNGHVLYQAGAASGFSITSIQAGGYTGTGGSSHGTEIHVSGGAGGVIYRMVCFYTTISKNDMY